MAESEGWDTVAGMASKNPILSRYEKTGQSGFAYDEGRSAYAAASGAGPQATPATTAAPTAATPPAGTREQFDLITAGGGARVTMADVLVKTAIVFGVAVVFAFVGWNVTAATGGSGILLISMLAMLGLGLVNSFKRKVSPALIGLYAVASGFTLGSISLVYNEIGVQNEYQGLVLQAVIATMTAFGVMLALYATGVVKVDRKFMSIMLVAMVSYLVIALASLVAALFGVGGGWGFYGVGGWGIALAIVGVLLASFSLMLDFEAIKQGINMGLPERESWRMAFGLLVTLVWLYLEILRLLALISGRE